MAQLGTLTAGIAHELNNPAAAAKRGANQLMTAMDQLQRSQFLLAKLSISEKKSEIFLFWILRERKSWPPIRLDLSAK